MDRFRRRVRRDDGAVAVEFLIVAPILLVVLFAIVEFGIVWSQLENYVSAAREGARYAAVRCQPDAASGCTDALIQTRVQNASTDPIPAGSVHETIVCGTTTLGRLVTVSWGQPLTYSIPFFGARTYTDTIKASFRCE